MKQFQWISGRQLLYEDLRDELTGDSVSNHTDDSLFQNPGILQLPERKITMEITDGSNAICNSNSFHKKYKARIVKNNTPFQFDQKMVEKYPHAQHRLRVITYNYADNYVNDYLVSEKTEKENGKIVNKKGSGLFIEKHEFIQAITPMNKECGGFVILGSINKNNNNSSSSNSNNNNNNNYNANNPSYCDDDINSSCDSQEKNQELELLAVSIPFGYTLLVDSWCIHGDSTLTGMFMMAMTGNHTAMQTADTVFMKNGEENVTVSVSNTNYVSPKYCAPLSMITMTSNEKDLLEILKEDEEIRKRIKEHTPFWWKAVITALPLPNLKTLNYLPNPPNISDDTIGLKRE
eukprot:Pgem_evm1s11456